MICLLGVLYGPVCYATYDCPSGMNMVLCIALYCIVLCCTVLRCTTLYSIMYVCMHVCMYACIIVYNNDI